MSARLIEPLPGAYADASNMKAIFTKVEIDEIHDEWERREQLVLGEPKSPAKPTCALFFLRRHLEDWPVGLVF